MKTIKVSFIIPVYNAEKYINNCVMSIICQDNGEIEIILVDDGSTDKSFEICKDLMILYPDLIIVIKQENKGSYSARLQGVSQASGDYIFFLDADDYILRGSIEHIFEDIATNSDIYIYNYVEEYNDGREKKIISPMTISESKTFSSQDRKTVFTVFMEGVINTVCATGIRKQLLKDIPNLQDKMIKNGEDRLMKMFLLLAANTVTFVPYAFYHCRWISGSQGDELRSGIITRQIFEDFCVTWSIEREKYTFMGFSSDEVLMWDAKKLVYLCTLLERRYTLYKNKLKNIDQLILIVGNHSLFRSLNSSVIRKRIGLHTCISSLLIQLGKLGLLHFYWQICDTLRRIKYGKKYLRGNNE